MSKDRQIADLKMKLKCSRATTRGYVTAYKMLAKENGKLTRQLAIAKLDNLPKGK